MLSSTSCTAVDANGNEITFAPGGSPSPTSASIDGSRALTAVACPTTTVCTAVDGSGNEISFDPTAGTVTPSASHIDSPGGELTGVSCPTTSQCVAVDSLGSEVTYAPTSSPGAAIHGIDQPGIANVTAQRRLLPAELNRLRRGGRPQPGGRVHAQRHRHATHCG